MPRILSDDWEDAAEDNPQWAVAYALLRLAEAQENVAVHLKYLGNGDAATRMGAIEGAAAHIGERLDRLAAALEGMSD